MKLTTTLAALALSIGAIYATSAQADNGPGNSTINSEIAYKFNLSNGIPSTITVKGDLPVCQGHLDPVNKAGKISDGAETTVADVCLDVAGPGSILGLIAIANGEAMSFHIYSGPEMQLELDQIFTNSRNNPYAEKLSNGKNGRCSANEKALLVISGLNVGDESDISGFCLTEL